MFREFTGFSNNCDACRGMIDCWGDVIEIFINLGNLPRMRKGYVLCGQCMAITKIMQNMIADNLDLFHVIDKIIMEEQDQNKVLHTLARLLLENDFHSGRFLSFMSYFFRLGALNRGEYVTQIKPDLFPKWESVRKILT